jgi:crotonobetainyl-CoA:carnitine CoA-transferase CaiB-like acyl-CoA transferase
MAAQSSGKPGENVRQVLKKEVNLSGPLAGYRIIDLSTVVMAPFATRILGDYGADVIKVESPQGDILREAGPGRHAGMGHLHLNTNRGKRSIVLNLKDPEGRETLLDLARSADALVYNQRPSAMARLKLAYEDLAAVNKRIVYLGAFGFSQRGPYADRPAYDDLIQGMAGIPWLSQLAGSDVPRYAPMILADRMVGAMTANALLAALLHRERTGRGQRVDVPMFESLSSVVLGEHLAGKAFQPPIGPVGYQRSLARRPYKTRDGYICAMVYNDKHWRAFLGAIGRPELFADPRFCSHAARHSHIEEVYEYLAGVLATRNTGEWLELLRNGDIPAERMYSIDDIINDEHLAAIGFFTPSQHPTEGSVVGVAVTSEWSDSRPDAPGHAPRLGENTEEVLREIGISPERIARLLTQGASK